MREFINAASKDELKEVRFTTMKYSKKAKDAFIIASISLFMNWMLTLYLILVN